jgi:hypothetical protein
MSLRTALEKALAAMMKMSLPCVGTFQTKERRENIWAQIAVSICVLLLPPVLAFAVLAPHPPGSVSGDILGASEPAAESRSTLVPTTEGSLWPPSRPPPTVAGTPHVTGNVIGTFSCVLYRRSMEYRGIDYAVRARPGRDEWLWTISTKHGRVITGQFTGTRVEAIAAARRAIARLLERQTQAAQNTN